MENAKFTKGNNTDTHTHQKQKRNEEQTQTRKRTQTRAITTSGSDDHENGCWINLTHTCIHAYI